MQRTPDSVNDLRALKSQIQRLETERISLELRCDMLAHELAEQKQRADLRARALARQAAQLQGARNEALATAKERSQFLARLSHELRTPLAVIVSAAEEMTHERGHRTVRQLIDVITDHARSASHVLNDILEFTRNESGTISVESKRFLIRREMSAAVQSVRQAARQKGLDLRLKVSRDVPTAYLGDAQRFRQVVTNILSNAVKFTHVGSIECELEPYESGLRVVIRDTGIGIRPAHREAIFRPFWQLDSSVSRRYEGSGLGLSISQQIVHAMGGTIAVNSKFGAGTEFTIQFPMTVATATRKKKAMDSSFMVGTRVLIVEDNKILLRLMSRVMERMGCEVVTSESGIRALQLLRDQAFDLILMDCQMPEMDGFRTTELIRKGEPQGCRTPIIAVTAHALERDRTRCLEAGMDAHIVKPVDQDHLVAIVAKLLKGRRRGAQQASAQTTLRSA